MYIIVCTVQSIQIDVFVSNELGRVSFRVSKPRLEVNHSETAHRDIDIMTIQRLRPIFSLPAQVRRYASTAAEADTPSEGGCHVLLISRF